MSTSQNRSLVPDLTIAATEGVKRRLVLGVDGLDKSGKTTFALTAPKPLVYLDFDIGKEGVIDRAPDADRILTSKPYMLRPSEIGWGESVDQKRVVAVMAAAEAELNRFRTTYLHALREPVMTIAGVPTKARSVVIDTGGEAWELLRLCEFGKLSQVKPHHYAQVNSLMRDLVRAAFDSDVNVIWLHKLKSEWAGGNDGGMGNKTGALERQGFKDMSYLVQANLLCYRIPAAQAIERTVRWKSGEGETLIPTDPRSDGDLGFRLVVGNSRHDATLEGLMLENEMATFPQIAAMMIPGTTPDDWA